MSPRRRPKVKKPKVIKPKAPRKYWKPGRRPIIRTKTDPYEWRVWGAMNDRFPDQICDRWRATDEGGGFANFVQDMGGFRSRPRRAYLARTDKTRPFSGDNCYWKPRKARIDDNR